MLENYEAAKEDRAAMCGDTGVPRWFVKIGNEAQIEGGPIALIRDGDTIIIDANTRSLSVDVSDADMEQRRQDILASVADVDNLGRLPFRHRCRRHLDNDH